MEDKYKIFNNGFNKILDLIGCLDCDIKKYYKKIVDLIPDNVVDAVSNCDDFQTESKQFSVDFMRLVNAVSLDYIQNKPYLRSEIYVHRLFEDDLSPKKLFES